MTERVLIVHALPGDEVASAASAILTLVDAGAVVATLVCLEPTGTSASAPATALGVDDTRVLGASDARWTGRPPRRYRPSTEDGPDAVSAADPAEIAADIAAVLVDLVPDVIVTPGVGQVPSHPDRARIHDALLTAADVIGVPVYIAASDGGEVSILVIEDERRRRAFDAAGIPDPAPAAETFARRVLEQRDWFAAGGWSGQLVACLLALLVGAFVGGVLTAAHGASVEIAGATVSWGLVVGLPLVAAFLVGLRLVFPGRLVVAAGALGMIAAQVALILVAGGGVLGAPDTPVGLIWTVGPVALAAATLGWPSGRRARTG